MGQSKGHKKSRDLSERRDRRKAKASNWSRPGRSASSGHVGHGGSGMKISRKQTPVKREIIHKKHIQGACDTIITIGEFIDREKG